MVIFVFFLIYRESLHSIYIYTGPNICNACSSVPCLYIYVGRAEAGAVTLKHIYEIAKVKQQDVVMHNIPLKSICRSVMGSARSMGIKVIRS